MKEIMSSREIYFSGYRRRKFNYSLDISSLPPVERARFEEKIKREQEEIQPAVLLAMAAQNVEEEIEEDSLE